MTELGFNSQALNHSAMWVLVVFFPAQRHPLFIFPSSLLSLFPSPLYFLQLYHFHFFSTLSIHVSYRLAM